VEVAEGSLRQLHKRGLSDTKVDQTLALLKKFAEKYQQAEEACVCDGSLVVALNQERRGLAEQERRNDVANLARNDKNPSHDRPEPIAKGTH